MSGISTRSTRFLIALAVMVGALVVPLMNGRGAHAQSAAWSTSVDAGTGSTQPGATQDLRLTVVPPTNDTVLVDLEIYDAKWRKVYQTWWDDQAVTAGQARTFRDRWVVPSALPTGTYYVMVGIFDPGWSGLLSWNGAAATIRVDDGPTATVAPTTTRPPAPTTAAPTTTRPPAPTTAAPTTTRPPAPTTAAPTTVAPTTPPPAGTQFTATFETDERARFDWRLQTTAEPPQGSFLGEHDTSCQGPDTYRTVQQPSLRTGTAYTNVDVTNSELVWFCAPGNDSAKGHMMTAIDTGSIATLSFSPKQVFNNVRQVCWDMNMNNLGEGKWVNVFVVPASDVAAHGGDLAYAAASGEEGAGTAAVPQKLPAGAFDFTWLRGTVMVYRHGGGTSHSKTFEQWMSQDPTDTNGNGAIDPADRPTRGIATSSAPRFTTCLDDAANRITVERPDGSTDTYSYDLAFPQGQVRVIFQDASYNPTKHNGFENHLTWHWDNITVS
jgi:hypothetical protein